MCGRFTQVSDPERYAGPLAASCVAALPPRFNVAPTQQVLAIKQTPWGENVLEAMRWGLVPHWSKGPDRRFSMINARVEGVADRPAYREPFLHRRCLIPADGFYEWHQGERKQPYYVHRPDGLPLYFAGLWEHWDDPSGQLGHIDSCSILVRDADGRLGALHDRMPVLLDPAAWADWLDIRQQDRRTLLQLLGRLDPTPLEFFAVSLRVNNPGNEGVELIRPVE